MISVIVPALNEAPHIEGSLRSLCNQSIKRDSYEIIVVDGRSSDCTVSIAERYSDNVIIQSNPGIGGARRDGAMLAAGDLLAFTDADTIVPPNWLEIIERNLGKYDASTGPILFPYHNLKTDILRSWRKFYSVLTILNFYYIIGGNMAVRAETYRQIGGHSNISLLDDYDLSLKLFQSGYTTTYDIEQEVYTSPRRMEKLFTYAVIVAYGHYHHRITKDYDKLLDYPNVDEMSVTSLLNNNKVGRNLLTAIEATESSIHQKVKRLV